MRPLFVFCADLHLEDGAWSTRPGIYGDAYYSFQQIVDYCVEHKLPLIMGGDVLEKKSNSARPIAKLCEGLSRMQHAGIEVYYIQGNHEYDRNAPWLSVHPWPIHMHLAGLFDINGVSVTGLDWLPRGDIQREFEKVHPDTDILVTHQVWKDFMGNVGRTECELTEVHHVQYVLAGDFHVTKSVTSTNAQGQLITMLSPGSTAMQDMGESPEKFFFVIARTDDGHIVFTPRPLKTRGALTYVVKDTDTLDQLCAGGFAKDIDKLVQTAQAGGYHSDVHKPLVKVKFDKRLPDAYLRVVTAIGETAHLFCEAITDKLRDIKQRESSAKTGRDELLAALADLAGEDSAAYKLGAALLQAEDVGKELDAQYSKYMSGEPNDAASAAGSEELGTPPLSGV